jgi:uncharacterized RDD family membrane protein YckC
MYKNDPEAQPFIKKSVDAMHNLLSKKKPQGIFKPDPEIEFNGEKFFLASFNRRLLAASIDMLIISLLLTPFSFIISAFGMGDQMMKLQMKPESMLDEISGTTFLKMLYESGLIEYVVFMQSFMIIMIGLYTILFWNKKGATPGKLLLKCKVVDEKTGLNLSVKQSIIRFIMIPFSILPVLIGLFMIDFTKKRQSLHDKIAGTVVIRKK